MNTTKSNSLYLIGIGVLLLAPIIYLVVDGLRSREEPTPPAVVNTQSIEQQIQDARNLAQSQPTDANYINLSLILINNQLYEEGILACNTALQINPNSAVAYNNLGFAQLKLNKFEASEASFAKALAIDPAFELAKNNLQLVLNEKSKSQEKTKELEKALLSNPNYDNAFALGLHYYNLGEYAKGIEAFSIAGKYQKDNALVYNNICSCYNNLGQLDLAIKNCKKALEIDPKLELAQNNLAMAENAKLKK